MDSVPHYLRTETKRLIPFARWFSPEDTHDIGLWPDMAELQSMMLEKDFESHLQKLYGSKSSPRGRAYEIGIVIQQGCHRPMQGRISKKNDPQVNRIITLISRVANKLLDEAFPDREKAMQHRLWTVNASFTFGDENNKDFTSIQLNFASVDQNLTEALGQFGALHIDGNDNPLTFTAMFALSHYAPNTFPGRFSISSVRLTCPTPPFAALVFTGTHPHFGSGLGEYPLTVGQLSPLRYKLREGLQYPVLPPYTPYRRLHVIPFPKMGLMKWDPKYLHGDIKTPQALGYFGTRRNQEEWHIRCFIRENHSTIEHDAEHWSNIFAWKNEFGVRETPRIEMVKEALQLAGKEDPAFEAFKKDIESVSCGKQYPGIRKPKKEQDTEAVTPRPRMDIKDELPVKMEGVAMGDVEVQVEGKETEEGENQVIRAGPKAKKAKKSAVKSLYKGGKSTYENWTHKDYASFFDPDTDEVPSNPSWKPLNDGARGDGEY